MREIWTHRLRVSGDTILNGLAKVISALFLEAVGGNLYLRTASDKSVLVLTATQLRDELSVYSKAQVDSLLVGKANAACARNQRVLRHRR